MHSERPLCPTIPVHRPTIAVAIHAAGCLAFARTDGECFQYCSTDGWHEPPKILLLECATRRLLFRVMVEQSRAVSKKREAIEPIANPGDG